MLMLRFASRLLSNSHSECSYNHCSADEHEVKLRLRLRLRLDLIYSPTIWLARAQSEWTQIMVGFVGLGFSVTKGLTVLPGRQ